MSKITHLAEVGDEIEKYAEKNLKEEIKKLFDCIKCGYNSVKNPCPGCGCDLNKGIKGDR